MWHLIRRTPVIVLLIVITLGTGAPPASAATACGTWSFGFTGTRLINDGISHKAGPFPIDLPADTYDVTVRFSDHHSDQPDPHQPNEQFRVRLDNGWISPASVDLSDDSDAGAHTFGAQQIEAATAISVQHLGVGGVNSINVDCVGFTPTAPAAPPEEPATPPEDNTPPPEEKPGQDIGDPASISKPPVQVDPKTPDADPAPSPEMDPAPRQPIEPEVRGAVEEQPPAVLALTGPSQVLVLANVGLVLLGFGIVLDHVTRGRARRD